MYAFLTVCIEILFRMCTKGTFCKKNIDKSSL